MTEALKKNKNIDFYLIGIGNQPIQEINNEIKSIIDSHLVFSGGKRHYELIKPLLPKKHFWITISGKMEQVVSQYKTANETVVIFTSGDPYFYGFGNTLKRFLPESILKTLPYFNSIQRLCHKTETNYNALKTVSVHGRDWSALDTALIEDHSLIGVLTDGVKTPAVIAKRLLQYGFDNYNISVGEALDGEHEIISNYDIKECTTKNHNVLNCMLLSRITPKAVSFGFPDHLFVPLPKRANMITKMPIRLNTIHALNLATKACFWDVGSCTGSVAIEAKKHYPQLNVLAFEKRKECGTIIQQNKEQFSTPGIKIIINDFFKVNLSELVIPDVVFIGGHGNRLKEMILKIHQLNPKVRFVTNAVLETTLITFKSVLTDLKYNIEATAIQINDHNKIMICSAQIEV
ncbi:precorrin-6y C5,15-methyltransferase (decarboxylating) subunit CbiE [uncultured Aquimarina sp.]|uniref:precorrin-6y C5,15-methyltransferase (decarboxylating) subunit CbiE n=1 Tax=uncultured Aquimarina sp. TaxID=575652 RepID=UPI00263171A4|nr:precorrin-6y C5,15-methyltransferase (decarboxylating) subunit CbiE [uncultured Aquimarina sp.]